MKKTSLQREFSRFYKIMCSSDMSSYKNLSSVKEVIAKYKGFDNWYQLSKFYSLKDKQSKFLNNFNNNEDLDLALHYLPYIMSKDDIKTYPKKIKKTSLKQHKHIPVVIGIDKYNSIFKSKNYYSINNYPLYMEGSTGAGTVETCLSLIAQNISNNEGVTFLDHKGDNIVYSKIYSLAEESNRLNDLYVVNFLTVSNFLSSHELIDKTIIKKNTHSIDPFNILISDKNMFENIFGETTTKWLYPYLYKQYSNNLNISLSSLYNLFSFHTLFQMRDNDLGNQKEVIEYLDELGVPSDTINCENENALMDFLISHILKNLEAFNILKIIEIYHCANIFSDNPDLDFEDLFLDRKILYVSYPCLEKSGDELLLIPKLLNNAILVADRNSRKYQTHFQNIYNTDAHYGLFYLNNTDELKNTFSNFIFTCSDYDAFSRFASEEKKLTEDSFQSFLLMKASSPNILNKKLFYYYSSESSFKSFFNKISDQQEGDAFFVDIKEMHVPDILSKNYFSLHKVFNNQKLLFNSNPYNQDIKITPIKCLYYSAPKPKYIKLIDHTKGE